MKKKLAILIIALSPIFVKGQYTYKPFRVDLGMGISVPVNDGAGIGMFFSAEPKYSLTSKLSLGLRAEMNMMFEFDSFDRVYYDDYYYNDRYDPYYDYYDENVKYTISLLPTIDYHFTTATFRPFIGGGVGIFGVTGGNVDWSEDWESRANFGFMIRGGFDVTHFRFALEYNHAGGDGHYLKYNYIAFSFSGYIGGKKQRY